MDHGLPAAEVERYSRQLVLPNFGPPAQLRLRNAKALIVGVGGLGCPAALYLAGAGVGTLGLADRPGDTVERSNLHRQIAHADARVGELKPSSAAAAIAALNPGVSIVVHDDGFTAANAVARVAAYDVVLDCTDNVAARYLVGDACAAARTPLVSAAAVGLDGQITTLCADDAAPCYRCLFPMPPPPACVGACDTAGVLGPVPGVLGTLQALEAVKVVAKMEATSTLSRRMLLFDGAESTFRTIRLRGRSACCKACGSTVPILKVADFDYDAFAAGGNAADTVPQVDDALRLDVREFARVRKEERAQYRLVDVRPERDFDLWHLEEAESIPLKRVGTAEVVSAFKESSQRTILICRRGNASRRALKLLTEAGVGNIQDVAGGLQAWHEHIDADFPLY